jgi:hypothetical protein
MRKFVGTLSAPYNFWDFNSEENLQYIYYFISSFRISVVGIATGYGLDD